MTNFFARFRKGNFSTRKNSRQLKVESLESRNLLAALTDDAYEQNDSLSAAYNLGSVGASKAVSSLVMADANDWYKFTTVGKPGATDSVSINLQNSQGNLNLALHRTSGSLVRTASTTANSETVSLSGLAAGTYLIRVYGHQGATNPSYSLSLNVGQQVVDDAYENNDTRATARDLAVLSSLTTVNSLAMADGHDWYKFTMNGAGTSSDFVAVNSPSTQGNLNLELYNASGTRLIVASAAGNNEKISLAGRSAGTYYVHVLGFNNAVTPSYTLQIDPGTQSAPSASSAFDIKIRYTGLSTAQQAVFEQAAATWEAIIVGDLPNATYGGVAVDDLLIDARAPYIDGMGGILGQAGPDALRSSGLPYHGVMEFDSADLNFMLSDGSLLNVIEHEMGHVLGIGTLWDLKGLLTGEGTSNPLFVGAQATAAYNSLFGTTAVGVPVENTGGSGTQDAHWRESIFGSELMTGWIGPTTSSPLSLITIGSLADLGYTVSFAAADPFSAAIAFSGDSTNSQIVPSIPSSTNVPRPSAKLAIHDAILTSLAGSRYLASKSSESLISPGKSAHHRAIDALFTSAWLDSELSPHLSRS